jgi:hypothetical protein
MARNLAIEKQRREALNENFVVGSYFSSCLQSHKAHAKVSVYRIWLAWYQL